MWPKPLPNHWILGQTIGVSVDAQDHVWIIHRAGSLEAGEQHATTNPPIAKCCAPAPPVLEFDPAGNLVNSWGGKGQGYDWPDSNHGITVDYKGNVWIGGNGRGNGQLATANEGQVGGVQPFNDNMVLKFTKAGKFLMQIGKPGKSKGSNDTENLRLPAKTYVDPQTNELFVADGYGNHRVIVFDAETGKYKRHWGAYGKMPDDVDQGPYKPNDPPPPQFRNPVHCAEISVDRLLYVCDRVNDRIQVFKPDGTFVKEMFIEKNTLGSGSVWDIAFSKDAAAEVHLSGRWRERSGAHPGSPVAASADQFRRRRAAAGRILRRPQHRGGFQGQHLYDRDVSRPARAKIHRTRAWRRSRKKIRAWFGPRNRRDSMVKKLMLGMTAALFIAVGAAADL